MEDEELTHLNNFCADLVSLKRWEAFPTYLLTSQRAAEWIRVGELCSRIGLGIEEVKSDLFAAWLADPSGEQGYALILFYDEESMWTMAARYHRQRLQNQAARVLAGKREEVP